MAKALAETVASLSTKRNLELERELIACSDLFDQAAYLLQAGEEAFPDPIEHYLKKGWRVGLEPNLSFAGNLLRPYFATLGFDEPPAVTWLVLRAAGWPVPASREEVACLASEVRGCGLFDETFYAVQMGKFAIVLDPAIHYVTVGERMGIAPSAEFNPAYYSERYPDVVRAGVNCLRHYVEHGRTEGRRGTSAVSLAPGRAISDPDKENVILVVHETSRTGAPILGWNIALHLARIYNLYTIRLGDGDLTPEFEALSVEVHAPSIGRLRHEVDIIHSLRSLLDSHKFRYAIFNSAESRYALESCVRKFIPTVLLMHEFGYYVHPAASLRAALDLSTEIVFPARIVARAAEEIYPNLNARETHILPQGMSKLPASEPVPDDTPSAILEQLTYRHDVEGTFMVLGAGAVQIRKGVDLFLAAAASVVRSNPTRSIHFVWVGHGFDPQEDMSYSVYLQQQISRSGLTEYVSFLDEVSDLDPIYRIADAFLLASRLDPLPNVSIDAAMHGIPVICFRDASGTAELMLSNPATARGVVDHLDTEAAARVILEIAGTESLRERMAAATRFLAQSSFNMEAYVAQLDELGTAAAQRMKQRWADSQTLILDPSFDQDMFLGPSQIVETREESIVRYLAQAAVCRWDEQAAKGVRRPSPGFSPPIYAAAHPARLTGGVDPLADYVRQGKPAGPWQSVVLRPDDPDGQIDPLNRMRVALHAHIFYPDLTGDFLARIESNQTRCDLLISTNEAEKARQIQRVLAKYSGGTVDIRVVPNRGRDIGPLLSEFAGDLTSYDLVGHVHAKRSLFTGDGTLGDSWREFLWQNLLGGLHPMMDRIVAAFQRHDELGLVFPSDPHLIGWDDNRIHADAIATRMGWGGELPTQLDFPLGTMFWIHQRALQPFLDLRLSWDDYPLEPLPYDGTILHALERLSPIASKLAGFNYAVTHVFGVSW